LPVPVRKSEQKLRGTEAAMTMRKKQQVVVFVGGVTYLEIAAVRQLKQLVGVKGSGEA